MANQGIALQNLAMLRKQFQSSLLLHVIIYLSPKCLKRVEKVTEENRLFQKTRIQTILDKSPWDSTAIFIFFCYFSVLSLLKQCSVFEILLQFSLPPPYTQLKLGKNSGYTRPTYDFLYKNIALVQRVSHLGCL